MGERNSTPGPPAGQGTLGHRRRGRKRLWVRPALVLWTLLLLGAPARASDTPPPTQVVIPLRGNLSRAHAHWLRADTIAWNIPGVQSSWTVQLHYAPDGALTLGPNGVSGGTAIPLTLGPAGPPPCAPIPPRRRRRPSRTCPSPPPPASGVSGASRPGTPASTSTRSRSGS